MSFPTKDSLLVPYSENFNTRINAAPATFALTAAQATDYTAVHTPYVAAQDAVLAAAAAGTRSKSLTAARDSAKAALLAYGRQLYAIVQASSSVTDANKELLGVVVRKTTLTPVPPPSEAPNIDIIQRVGTTVRIRLHDGTGTRRAKPAGVQGASVFSFVGAAAPAEVGEWTFQGNTSKTLVDVQFDTGLAPGTVVWLSAFWYNPRGESGIGCTPVSAILAGGGLEQAA